MIGKVMITVVIDGDKLTGNLLTSGENKKNFKNYKKFHLYTQNNPQKSMHQCCKHTTYILIF